MSTFNVSQAADIIYIAVFGLVFPLNTLAQKEYHPSDVPTEHPVIYQGDQAYKKVKVRSQYLTMRDGIKIAMDLYLPKDLEEGEKLPTLIYQSRYWRRVKFRWPVSMFMGKFPFHYLKEIEYYVLHGYAVVITDVRGTGASFGSRLHPWTLDEINDGGEIVDWIIKQKWSNGNVGATGISYSGIAAEFLGVNKHPNVKAIAPRFTVFDLYNDVAFPGGVHLEWFTKTWGDINEKLDQNKVPVDNFFIKTFVFGVQPVKTKNGKRLLKQALIDHRGNLNPDDFARGVKFKDDMLINGSHSVPSMAVFSPYYYLDSLNQSEAAIYSYSGWFDGNYAHAAIKRHINLTSSKNKLIIGPWEHGGKYNNSPSNPGLSGFDQWGELLKFFNYYLKEENNGLEKDLPIHYFTMGEEKWKATTTWPPPGITKQTYYFQDHNLLSTDKPSVDGKSDLYQVDTSTGTGEQSRWKPLIREKYVHLYPDRKDKDLKLLYYTTAPLKQDIEVTGHPVVSLYVTSTSPDVGFFVYLEDINERGDVSYVTEGQFRSLHKKVSEEPIYKDLVPYHSYKRKDFSFLSNEKSEQVTFDLYPTSYLFKKGHSIRISIAGADSDYFKQITPSRTEIEVFHSEGVPSSIELPIMMNDK